MEATLVFTLIHRNLVECHKQDQVSASLGPGVGIGAFTNILVVYDSSEHGRKALDTAVKVAQCSNCSLMAQMEGRDLIVMGLRGPGMVQGLLPGSVSYRVLHHATIPC